MSARMSAVQQLEAIEAQTAQNCTSLLVPAFVLGICCCHPCGKGIATIDSKDVLMLSSLAEALGGVGRGMPCAAVVSRASPSSCHFCH